MGKIQCVIILVLVVVCASCYTAPGRPGVAPVPEQPAAPDPSPVEQQQGTGETKASRQGIELSIRAGGFGFTSDDPGFTDYWDSSGYLVGGRASFQANDRQSLCLDIEDVKSSRSSYFDRIGLYSDTNAHILSVQVLYKYKLIKEGPIIPYSGGGLGISVLTATVYVESYGDESSMTDFSYRGFIGVDIGDPVFFEAGYMSGGRNGNTGAYLSGGLRYFIDMDR